MKIYHFRDEKIKEEIKRYFSSSNLIPFIGTGFTLGCKSKRGTVPDGNRLDKSIKEIIAAKKINGITKDEIFEIKPLKNTFNLLTEEYISITETKSFLSSSFSDVKIPDKNKRKFLHLNWPHIITFNIDDAIENHTSGYKTIVPNRPTSREYLSSNKCILKLHGDIAEFLAYDDASLIFTWRQYASSISENRSLLNFIGDISKSSAFLFIGCSLDSELDIIHLGKDYSLDRSFYLKKGEISLDERLKLKDYGINKVICFDDYGEIYEWLNETLAGVERKAPTVKISIDNSEFIQTEAIRVITNGGPNYIASEGERVAIASETFPLRDEIVNVRENITSNDCIFITGRRFSGKTTFLFQIVSTLKEYGITFWSSNDSYSPNSKSELESLENHIFIFDSNSLTNEAMLEILKTRIHTTSRIIFCSSSGDAELFRFNLHSRKVKYYEISLSDRLTKNETIEYNRNLNRIALPSYNLGENLLNFAFRCYDEYKSELGESELFSKNFEDNSKIVLLLISAFEHANESVVGSMIEHFDMENFILKNERVFEIEKSNSSEKNIICNSKSWLIKTIRIIISQDESAVLILVKLIESLHKNGFTSHASNLIRFDKLNELYGPGESSGIFIKSIYENIEKIYSDDSHYWLQRAKAELITATSSSDIDNGVSYTRKIRADRISSKNSTYYSATLVLAQLYAKGYVLTNDDNYLVKFIEPCYESLTNHENNQKYIRDMTSHSSVKQCVSAMRAATRAEFLVNKEKVLFIFGHFD